MNRTWMLAMCLQTSWSVWVWELCSRNKRIDGRCCVCDVEWSHHHYWWELHWSFSILQIYVVKQINWNDLESVFYKTHCLYINTQCKGECGEMRCCYNHDLKNLIYDFLRVCAACACLQVAVIRPRAAPSTTRKTKSAMSAQGAEPVSSSSKVSPTFNIQQHVPIVPEGVYSETLKNI